MDTPIHHITLAHVYLPYKEASVDGYECREREITRDDVENVILQLYDAEEARNTSYSLDKCGRAGGMMGLTWKSSGALTAVTRSCPFANSQVFNPRFVGKLGNEAGGECRVFF